MTIPWGRLEKYHHELLTVNDLTQKGSHCDYLAIGNSRSYGDVGTNKHGAVVLMSSQDRFLDFDPENGFLTVEAGMQLGDIQSVFYPRGWGLPVTPGTQFATIGGAVANDVHGKNHHSFGSLGNHILSFRLFRSDIGIISCSASEYSELFFATIGGLGLTGVILDVTLGLRRLSSGWLCTVNKTFYTLRDFFEMSAELRQDYEYSVSWVDCTSRSNIKGIMFNANHDNSANEFVPKKKSRNFPFNPPFSLINKTTLKIFNKMYFNRNALDSGANFSDYQSYFYPLDTLGNWNRIYGKSGFYQYQSVVPTAEAFSATTEMFRAIADAEQGSFLMVLKEFGDIAPLGLMSFPMPGVTLAMDFPNKGAETLKLFDRLDSIVKEAGGRLYPAKDTRMKKETYINGYSNFNEFIQHLDPNISSTFMKRILNA